jgi:hypothetical protein
MLVVGTSVLCSDVAPRPSMWWRLRRLVWKLGGTQVNGSSSWTTTTPRHHPTAVGDETQLGSSYSLDPS